jgi:lipid A 3-O-deacylase
MPASKTRAAVRGMGPLVALALALLAFPAGAASLMPDMVFGTAGYKADVGVFGGGAGWYLTPRSATRDETGLSIRVDGEIAYWHGFGRPTPYEYLFDFSATPIFRWTFAQPASPRVFVEGGLGIHFLTATRINNDRQFGISFQFGEIGAIGVAFGENNRYELKLFVQHVSNGNINRENWGLTTPGLTFSMALP